MILATAKRALLTPAAGLYSLLVRLRIAAYETGYLKSRQLGSPVISVGNITTGGTGKTPLVGYIARYLAGEGYPVAILTRGYKRKTKGQIVLNGPHSAEAHSQPGVLPAPIQAATALPEQSYIETGDEPLMLANALPAIPIIVNKNRYEAGRWAERSLDCPVLILDDGYQHLSLARDLNILVLDATDPFGGLALVPSGRLREPLYAIKRADAVIVTRAHRPFDEARLTRVVRLFCEDKTPILYVYSSITGLRHIDSGVSYPASQFREWNAWIACGIGNPHAFADDVGQLGIGICGQSFFRDHHGFSRRDVDELTASARAAGADCVIVTEKDAVRLEEIQLPDFPFYAANLEIQSEDEVRFKSLLLRSVLSADRR